jgi:hypothetical protein
MNEQYLWDGSGEPDAEIGALETSLGQFRYRPHPKRNTRRIAMAAAAVLLIAAAALWAVRSGDRISSWRLAMNGGDLRQLRIGQSIDTGDAARAVLESEATGRLEVGPGSRVRLMEDRRGAETFSLEHGLLHARIWAPPRTFVVETPSARTIDLGCEYTLRIAKNGAGTLRVETGWVAFVRRGAESFIPAGAICRTTPKRGPGTPWFEDAAPAFAAAIARLDTGEAAALDQALAAARPQDAFSLWHLMTRLKPEDRGRVFDRFTQLTSLPPGVTRGAIERGDRQAIDGAWDSLHLGSTAWWRGWERNW